MEKRRYGRTNHMSTLAVFGAVALGRIDQNLADQVVEKVIEAGVNHIDIAPSYGQAETRLGPWMPKIRDKIFLGCKTTIRSKEVAISEFQESLERLQTGFFDLYQLHAVTSLEELDKCTKKGGALEGVIEMQEKGLTRFIGITGHGMDVPKVFLEALNRYDFDSVLFPINPTLFSDADYRSNSLSLLDLCEKRDVGVMIIKAVAKESWKSETHSLHTWYRPFEEEEAIQKSINFVLSQKLTHICTPGDYRILPKALKACENFELLSLKEQESLIKERASLENIF